MHFRTTLITLVVLLSQLNIKATTVEVPVDFPTIQGAIDNVVSGDTVLVRIGTYYENIDFLGKDIVVGSFFLTSGDTSYIATTIIDGSLQDRVVRIENGESALARLTGFTIRNGDCGIRILGSSPRLDHLVVKNNVASGTTSAYSGGGIYIVNGSNPELNSITVKNNTAAYQGGGITIRGGSDPILTNIEVRDNTVDGSGGGIAVNIDSSPILYNVLIVDNEAFGSWGRAGGLLCENGSTPKIYNATIANNTGVTGGGIGCYFPGDHPDLENSNVWNNSPDQIYLYDGNATLNYSNVQGGYAGTSNTNIDPEFEAPLSGDYNLSSMSPCINSGNPDTTGTGIPALDLNGEVRIMNGIIDQGPYEYSATSIDGSELSEVLSIAPNPGNGEIILAFNDRQGGSALVEVYDLHGKLIHTQLVETISDRVIVSLDKNNPTGTYMIHTSMNGRMTSTLRYQLIR